MTLVSPPTADMREGTSRRKELLQRRACTVFESCATVSPPTLPALASAFADYLLAWRETSPDRAGTPTAPAAPQRLRERVDRLDAILRHAEGQAEPSRAELVPPADSARPVNGARPLNGVRPAGTARATGAARPAGTPRPADGSRPAEITMLEDEAARLLAETRDLLRSLDTDRPAAQRVRLALVAAWGRYDDALATLRPRAIQASAGDLRLMAGLRDALLQQLEAARVLCSQSTEAYINGGSAHR